MITKTIARFAALLFLSALIAGVAAFAQGSLTPPAAPAPLFKTLDQVEPCTPISSLPFTITNSGSFYLTRSFTNSAGSGVTINADDVTLDLRGFAISPSAASLGIIVTAGAANTPIRNVLVRNGTISQCPIGVKLSGAMDCIVEDLRITECNAGITLMPNGTAFSNANIIRRCSVHHCVANGFGFAGSNSGSGNVFEHCDSLNNDAGFEITAPGNLIINCRASGNTNGNFTIVAGNRLGAIVTPTSNPSTATTSGGGTGTSDPFANLRF